MRFAYLFFACLFAGLAAALCLLRRDIAKGALLLGASGGAGGIISEYFYLRDYWRPPTLFGAGHASVEDFIFGTAITTIAILTYPVLSRTKLTVVRPASFRRGVIAVAAVIVGGVVVLNLWLGMNSIFASSLIFVLIASYMIARRPDLFKPALVTGACLTVLAIVIYVVVFDLFLPDFWSRYWLLYGTRWDAEIFGHVPLTELLWYFCWGLFGGVYYPFLAGKAFRKDNHL